MMSSERSGQWRDGEEARLQAVVAAYLDRLNAGEAVDPLEVVTDHPDIAEQVLAELEAFIALGREAERELGSVGDYKLLRRIGRGGMGVVYEAWEGAMERGVALKVLPAEITADTRRVARFLREARLAGKLRHPNVVPVFGMGVEAETLYYAMELVDGVTLAEALKRSPEHEVDAQECFQIAAAFAGAAEGLQHAHSKGIIHRDLKPSNLMLESTGAEGGIFQGRLRILDFGLARLEGEETLTASGELLGTPLYMSPEQARAARIDQRTDIYSLGAALYETLARRPPFQGRDYQETLSRIISREVVPPRRLNARIPKDLETIALKCLMKEPGGRYGTAEALAQDLRRFVRGDPIEARPQSRWEKLLARAWRSRAKLAATAAAALLVILAGSAALKLREEALGRAAAEYERKVAAAVMKLEQASLARSFGGPEGLLSVPGEQDAFLEESGAQWLAAVLRDLEEAARLAPRRLDAHYHRARALVLLGRERQALEVLDRVLELRPGFLPARALRAGVLDRLGEHAAAEPLSKLSGLKELAAGSAAPGPEGAWERPWLAAHLASREGRWAEAAAAFGELLALARLGEEPYLGFSIAARLGRGAAFLEAEQPLDALKDFAVAQDAWPETLEPLLFEGKALLRLGKTEEAEELFLALHARSRFPDEVAWAVADLHFWRGEHERELGWIGLCRQSPQRERRRAWSFWHLGERESAVAAAEKALELKEDDALSLQMLAELLGDGGKHAAAVEICERAVELEPENVMVRGRLGMLLWGQGELEAAREQLQQALGRNPRDAIVHAFLGRCLFQLEQRDEAMRLHERGIGLAPKRSDLHYHYGRDLLLDGRVAEAIEAFDRALALDPVFSWPRTYKGEALEKQGDDDAALVEYRAAVRGFPKHVRSHFFLARLLEKQERLAEAFVELVSTLELEPAHAEAHAKLRELLAAPDPPWGGEEVDRLLAVLESGLRREPGNPRLLRTFALAAFHHPAEQERETARALALLERALSEAGAARPELLGVIAELEALEGRAAGAVLLLEEALRLPQARKPLAAQLESCRRALLPDLVSFASIDAALERPEVETIIGEGATWRFFRGTEEPPAGWEAADFDDSRWDEGESPFGYGEPDLRTELSEMRGGYSTLYLRRRFELPLLSEARERILRLVLSVKADDGFVAYLDGEEVARTRAGAPGERLAHSAVATAHAPEPLEAVEVALALPLEPEGSALEGASRSHPRCLALQGLNNSLDKSSDFFLLPVLAVELRPDPARGAELLDAFRASSAAATPALFFYFEGRLLAASGNQADAAGRFLEAAAAAPEAPEPLLRLAEYRRAAGEPAAAEELLRGALAGGLARDRDLWLLWVSIAFADLGATPAALLRRGPWPAALDGDGAPAADLRWLLEELAAHGVLRIDCGGEGQASALGSRWSADRFFQGGEEAPRPSRYLRAAGGAGRIAGAEDDAGTALYRAQRRFAPDQLLAPGYTIPLPPGSYAVTLHFAEIETRRPGRRVFDILLEGEAVRERYEPLRAGFRTAERLRFTAAVRDGILDIVFIPREGSPAIAAIEVERTGEL